VRRALIAAFQRFVYRHKRRRLFRQHDQRLADARARLIAEARSSKLYPVALELGKRDSEELYRVPPEWYADLGFQLGVLEAQGGSW
jgi:hypothetical protein